jgi:hypothetical protein
MAFVFGYITFLSYPLTAVAVLIILYKPVRAALRLVNDRAKADV